eukprot:jgi/Orpsp1_1/1182800/evm.model.c7180000082705.1
MIIHLIIIMMTNHIILNILLKILLILLMKCVKKYLKIMYSLFQVNEAELNGEISLYLCVYDNDIYVDATDNAGMKVLDPIDKEIDELFDELFDKLFNIILSEEEKEETEETIKQMDEIREQINKLYELKSIEYDKIANILQPKDHESRTLQSCFH